MSESPQFIERLIGGEVEQVEGGEGAFDPDAFVDEAEDGDFEETSSGAVAKWLSDLL